MQPTTSSLFEPVSEELRKVSELFDDTLSSELPNVKELCLHVRGYRGKMLRPLLVLLSGKACGRITDEHITLATVVEMVHMATLVHDDVLDSAEVRRGGETVNAKWGNKRSVLFGDYLISQAFHLCSSLDSQYASRLIGSTTNTVCEGELLQIAYQGNLGISEETYLDIVSRKTASLTSACCVLGAKYSQGSRSQIAAMEHYGLALGIAFQIEDDLLDVAGDEERCGKTLGLDVEEGIATMPIIRHLATIDSTERNDIFELLGNGRRGTRSRVREQLADSGAIDYSKSIAYSYIQSAIKRLEELPISDARRALEDTAQFAIQRDF
jgi:octaprenyl-diphosphate synthase